MPEGSRSDDLKGVLPDIPLGDVYNDAIVPIFPAIKDLFKIAVDIFGELIQSMIKIIGNILRGSRK